MLGLMSKKNDYLVVHFDLDVLSPEDFRSIYPAEPYLKSFDAAVGEMTLEEITNLLLEVSKKAEIVGLTIAEHLPWDAFRLRNSLAILSLFKESEYVFYQINYFTVCFKFFGHVRNESME